MLRSLLVLAALAAPASAAGLFDPANAVPDAELADMRGGFALPNGVDVALTVQTDTAVDGALILRTVYRLDAGAPTLTLYAPGPGETGPRVTATTTTPASAGVAAPVLTLDRAGGVNTLAWSQPLPISAINTVVRRDGGAGAAPPGLTPLPVLPGGPGVQTAAGAVSVADLPRGMVVVLDGATLDVQQVVGQSFTTIIANTANDRAIDSVTTLDLDVRNAGALVATTATLRTQDIVQNALAGRSF